MGNFNENKCSQVAPAHAGIELGIGDAILFKALANATGRSDAQLRREYHEVGDLGEVAVKSKGRQRTMFQPKPLTVRVRPELSVPRFCALARLARAGVDVSRLKPALAFCPFVRLRRWDLAK